jgi:hypothetical protein
MSTPRASDAFLAQHPQRTVNGCGRNYHRALKEKWGRRFRLPTPVSAPESPCHHLATPTIHTHFREFGFVPSKSESPASRQPPNRLQSPLIPRRLPARLPANTPRRAPVSPPQPQQSTPTSANLVSFRQNPKTPTSPPTAGCRPGSYGVCQHACRPTRPGKPCRAPASICQSLPNSAGRNRRRSPGDFQGILARCVIQCGRNQCSSVINPA